MFKIVSKIYKFITMLLMLIFIALSSEVDADDIIIVADEWCPYNCIQNTDEPGFIVEIAKYVFEKEGHQVIYKTVPWARAIQGTRSGTYDAIIGAGKEETPDFIFPEVEVSTASHRFFVRIDSKWTFENINSLSNVNLGVIRGYSYGTLYNDYIAPNKSDPDRITIISGENHALARNINMLIIGRIDALVEDKNVISHHFRKNGGREHVKEVGVASNEKIYLAFSPQNKNSIRYVQTFNDALKKLRGSQFVADLLEKYEMYN
jgi:polar amino acid transport system substrate-binding protein